MVFIAIYIALIIGIIDYALVYRETLKNDKLRAQMGEPKYGTSTYIIMNCNLLILGLLTIGDALYLRFFELSMHETWNLNIFVLYVVIAYILVRLLEVVFIIIFKKIAYSRATRKQKQYDIMRKQLEHMQQGDSNETNNLGK